MKIPGAGIESSKWIRNVGFGVLRVKMEPVEVGAYESCMVVAGNETHRDPLSAVSPELQLKFQDSGITVTNWDRIRLNRKPNYPL